VSRHRSNHAAQILKPTKSHITCTICGLLLLLLLLIIIIIIHVSDDDQDKRRRTDPDLGSA
jgi:hypothetical protein